MNLLAIDLPSTKNIGIAIYKNSKLIHTDHHIINDKQSIMYYILKDIEDYNIDKVVYENPLGTKQSLNAGIIIGLCYTKNIECNIVHPRHMTKVLELKCKGLARKKELGVIAKKYCPLVDNQHSEDAICLGLVYLIDNSLLNRVG